MMNKYFICAKIKNKKGEITEQFYANDRNSGGYPYFSNHINNSEVKSYDNIEDAKKYLKEEYCIRDGKLQFNAYYGDNIVGLPYIVKTELKIETVFELT